jgi:hypothetical protein
VLRRASVAAAPSLFGDIALTRAFPRGLSGEIRSGRSTQVTAIQYALMRLGYGDRVIDGSFGPNTLATVRAFQEAHNRDATLTSLRTDGVVDQATLLALDAALANVDAVATPSLAVLHDWTGLSAITRPTGTIDWNNVAIAAAYSRFVGEYWPHLRRVVVECDCKTVGLFLMDAFRTYFQAQTGAALPMPSSADGRRTLGEIDWSLLSFGAPGGFFTRLDARGGRAVRPGYGAERLIEPLDPTASMMRGTNLRAGGIVADAVSRVAHVVDPGRDNRGDVNVPEIDIAALRVGDTIFMNHNRQRAGVLTRDTRIDHAMTVVGLTRNADGRVTSLVLAVGSFDDVSDADSTTPPSGARDINNYIEELTIGFNADGTINYDSAVTRTTWASEPAGLVAPRYTPRNTLMELNGGGSIFVGRWGSRMRR